MSLLVAISGTIVAIKATYAIAIAIKQCNDLHGELGETVDDVSTALEMVERVMYRLENHAHQVTVDDEKSINENITSIKSKVADIKHVLEKVQEKRGFIKRLLMKKNRYQRRLNQSTQQLYRACQMIQGTTPGFTFIEISPRKLLDFRSRFHHLSDKEVSIFDFSIAKNTPNTILTIATEQFDPAKCSCYMKLQKTLSNAQFFISYQLRTWSAPKPISTILEKRREAFTKQFHNKSTSDLTGSISSLSSVASAYSVSPTTNIVSNINHEKLDFSEFFLSHDDVCGMALTQSIIYVATKCEITVFSLDKQKIIAQYGIEGDGPNSFKRISYIYISPNDETSLYIVDRGQNVVHQYKINDSGLCFEFVRRYVVIGNNNQPYKLQSCAIYKTNLYVSDSGNNCLHIFPLNGERQSKYLFDDSMTPFSPGPICAHGKYLCVANCSAENPSILVLNEECEPVDWFRNKSLEQILAIDIEPNINELFILTTTITKDENNELKKRPLIVSMDLLIRSEYP